jgi:diguanylate cyclase (GGDEF)-like protein
VPRPPLAATRSVDVRTARGSLGTVSAYLPYDARLAHSLHAASGLGAHDPLAIVVRDRIVAASPALHGTVRARGGVPVRASVGGVSFRVLESQTAAAPTGSLRVAALIPQHEISSGLGGPRERLLLFLALLLLAVALVAYTQGRNVVRTLARVVSAAHAIASGRLDQRVPVDGRDELTALGRAFNEMADQLQERLAELESERARLRDAFARFGDALSATHDPEQLLQVVLEATAEATGAAGATLVDERGGIRTVGDVDSAGERLELPLVAGQSSFGTLVLVGAEFGDEERLTASSLAAHAVVALENARLHSIVEEQALVDSLTGLANRRHCEETLTAELARAERFGSALTAIVADLDDFKRVNDEHGHPAGDGVLREFAAVLRENVREADVAGRWGGEEFLLLLPGTDALGGEQLAERIRATLAERVILTPDGVPIRLTVSLGVATHPDAGDADALLEAADAALYSAKRAGKNRVVAAHAAARRP